MIYEIAEITEITRNFGIVMTSEVSVAISGMNFVIENATHPAIADANSILVPAFQNALSSNSHFDLRCNIYNNIMYKI